jgi:hypothetical protein
VPHPQSSASVGIAHHQLPTAVRLTVEHFDGFAVNRHRISGAIDRRALKVRVQLRDVADDNRPSDAAPKLCFWAIIPASTLRIASRPTSISPDRVAKRASASYKAITASRSPELKHCSNKRGQSSGSFGNIVSVVGGKV